MRLGVIYVLGLFYVQLVLHRGLRFMIQGGLFWFLSVLL